MTGQERLPHTAEISNIDLLKRAGISEAKPRINFKIALHGFRMLSINNNSRKCIGLVAGQ